METSTILWMKATCMDCPHGFFAFVSALTPSMVCSVINVHFGNNLIDASDIENRSKHIEWFGNTRFKLCQ